MSLQLSVLMSVWAADCPLQLRESLESLCEQSRRADEIVLVQDGPLTPELEDVIHAYKRDLNIVSVPLDENQGLASALNTGLKHCRAPLVARMDSDDIALPERFEKQLAFMQEHPEISVSSCWIEEFCDESLDTSIRRLPTEHSNILNFAKLRCPISHPAAIFKKDDVLAVGGYPSFRKAQDYALWSLMLNDGKQFANLDVLLLKMRVPGSFYSRRAASHFRYEIKVLNLQRRIGFISRYEYMRNLAMRFMLRLSPVAMKKVLYRVARG